MQLIPIAPKEQLLDPNFIEGRQLYHLSNWRELSADYGFVLPDVDCPISALQVPGLLAELNNLQAVAQAKSFDELHEVSAVITEEIIQAQASATDDVEQLLLEYLLL